jgi:MbtH protein
MTEHKWERPLDQSTEQCSKPVCHSVVVNKEEQYAIWPGAASPPPGWSKTGFQGTAAECSEHIDKVWIDMRPSSLRATDGDPGKFTAPRLAP